MKFHYYEAHLIVRPTGPAIEQAADKGNVLRLAQAAGFWGAVLSHDESDEEKAGDLILTTREQDIWKLYDRMVRFATMLKEAGHPAVRLKIEQTIFDTKAGDPFPV